MSSISDVRPLLSGFGNGGGSGRRVEIVPMHRRETATDAATPPVTHMLQRPRRVAHQSVTAHFRWPEHASAKPPSRPGSLVQQQPRTCQTSPSRHQIPTFFGSDQAGLNHSACAISGVSTQSRETHTLRTWGIGPANDVTCKKKRKAAADHPSTGTAPVATYLGPSQSAHTHSATHTRTDACCFRCRLVIVTTSSILSR